MQFDAELVEEFQSCSGHCPDIAVQHDVRPFDEMIGHTDRDTPCEVVVAGSRIPECFTAAPLAFPACRRFRL